MAFKYGEEQSFVMSSEENETEMESGDFGQNAGIVSGQFQNPDEALAELEKLVAIERDELEELSTVCEQLTEAIESERIHDKVDEKFSEMERLIDEFTSSMGDLESTMDSVCSIYGSITATINEKEADLSTQDGCTRSVLAEMKELLEMAATKQREVAVMKKSAETRHMAEIKDLDDDIKSTRPIICDIDKDISKQRADLKALDDEIAKLSVDLEQSEKDLEETNRNLDALQQQVVNLDDHDADQVDTLATEMKAIEEKRASLKLRLEAFCRGETDMHKEYETAQRRIQEFQEKKTRVRQQIVGHQRESEKRLDARMTELKELNRRLSDVMDTLNLSRQKEYTERLDYDYMLSKTELDFEKLAGSEDQVLSELEKALKTLKRDMDEFDELKRQLAAIRSKEARQEKNGVA